MNVNVEALRASLDDRVLDGRSAPEAAGEMLWLAKIEHDHGVIASQTVAGRESLISEWLAAQLGSPLAEIGFPMAEARGFPRFLDTYLDLNDPTASLKVDAAVTAWWQRSHG